MTQEIYQKAIKFAGNKHKNQCIPGTETNYVVHLSNVAMEILMAHKYEPDFDLDYAIQLALLHDCLEDTDTTYLELETVFNKEIAKGVMALTKNSELISKSEKMKDSLGRIQKCRKEVGMVKLADRITNLQSPPKHWPKLKIDNYRIEAKMIHDSLKSINNYLSKRLVLKIKTY